MRVCTACNTATDETGRFCPGCGAALADDDVGAAATAELGSSNAQTDTLGAADGGSTSQLIGTTVDGFEIDGVLGGGAFGTVFRGRQLGLDRPVAIKIPTHEIARDPVMAKRFAREARAAARVTHPGVVAIYGVGELPDRRPYLAMQLIDGEPLDQILADGPVPVLRALHLIRDVASALSETHAAGVVHRDLKPSNIMWRRDRNGDDRITLVDFGIAVAKPGNADATRLTANGLIGTPHYMSPEQAHGEHVDARADIYALGCLLFELVTGTTPFDGSGFEVLLAHLGRPPPAPSERNAAVPEVVDHLVGAMMSKKAEDRPQNADELVALLDDVIGQLDGRKPQAALPRPPRAKRDSLEPTRLDRPRPRRGNRRWLTRSLGALAAAGVGVIATLLVVGGGGAGAGSSAVADASVAAGSGSSDGGIPGAEGPIDGPGDDGPRRAIVLDDGEMAARATMRDPIIAGRRTWTLIEVWNAMGAPLDAANLVVTIEAPDGSATGITAARSPTTAGRFGFWHVFAAPGRYVVRVFPPEALSVFTVEVEVGT